jgi:uncharacterized protein YecA (UPF0149 family)
MEEMCMAKVLEFPENRSLLRMLEKTTEELVELHDALSKGYSMLQQLEDQVEKYETEYNKTLYKYAKCVGLENIPVKLLEHASQYLVVDIENGEIRYEPPEEDPPEAS